MEDVSFAFAIPYLIIAVIQLLLYGKERILLKLNRSPQKVRSLSFFILLVFVGLRGFLYTDFVNYYVGFEDVPKLYELTISDLKSTGSEIGFYLYESLFKTIVNNYHVWCFFNSFIDLFVIREVFKRYTSSSILPFVFFIAYWGLQFEFNLMRNVKGLLFFLISLKSLEVGNFRRYIICNFLGCLFHSSSLIYIIIYPFLRIKWKRGVLLVIFLGVNILYLSGICLGKMSADFFLDMLGTKSSEKVLDYVMGASDMGITIGYVERVIEMLLFIIFLDKFRVINRCADVFISCSILYFTLYSLFSDVAIFVQRFTLLFIIGYWILLSNLFYIQFKTKKLVLSFIICLCMTRIVLSNNTIISKYDNIIWGIESYELRRNAVYRFTDYN